MLCDILTEQHYGFITTSLQEKPSDRDNNYGCLPFYIPLFMLHHDFGNAIFDSNQSYNAAAKCSISGCKRFPDK